MPFTWNSIPNSPPRILPTPVPSGEISYEVKLVANSVDYGGEVRYNSTNHSYDIVYEFPSLNVADGIFRNGAFVTANISNATINVATINTATINTATITNATIQFGYTTGSPTSNLGIATKFYVDNAVASISGGTGPDSTANLFTAVGDLLVGFAPNTAHRLGVGTTGQTLTANSASPLKQSWSDVSGSQRVVGLTMGTHFHPSKKTTQLYLKRADGIIMQDGSYVPGWSNLIADITTTGAGGLDSNSARAANTWYEVYAIRNSSTGAKALLLHRTLNRVQDANWPATQTQIAYLRRTDTGLTTPDLRFITKISQSWVAGRTGRLSSIDVTVFKSSAPVGNVWITVQPDDGVGNASGAVLCTSDRMQVEQLPTSASLVRFVFDTAANLTSGNRYHLVAEGDFGNLASGASPNGVGFYGNTGPFTTGASWMANVGYTSGNLTIYGYGDCRVWNVITSTWRVSANCFGVTPGPQDLYFAINFDENITSLALPTGYNQYSLISYACTNGSSNFKEYHQQNRTMVMGVDPDWLVYSSTATTGNQFIPLEKCVPPISCSVQFYSGSYTNSLPLGARYSYDLQPVFTSGQYYDAIPRGHYSAGGSSGAIRFDYSGFFPHDGWNFIYGYSTGVGGYAYVTGIVF